MKFFFLTGFLEFFFPDSAAVLQGPVPVPQAAPAAAPAAPLPQAAPPAIPAEPPSQDASAIASVAASLRDAISVLPAVQVPAPPPVFKVPQDESLISFAGPSETLAEELTRLKNFKGPHLNLALASIGGDKVQKSINQKLINQIFKNPHSLESLTLSRRIFGDRQAIQDFLSANLDEKETLYTHDNLRKLRVECKLSSSTLKDILERAPNLEILEFEGNTFLPYKAVFSQDSVPHLRELLIGTGQYRYLDRRGRDMNKEIQVVPWLSQMKSLSLRGISVMEGLNDKYLPELKSLKLVDDFAPQGWKIYAPRLEILHASGCGLEATSLPSLLKGIPAVKDLDLSDNSLFRGGEKAFPLQTGRPLQSLSLAWNGVHDDHLQILFSHRPSFKDLQHLDLRVNGLTSKGIRMLMDMLIHDNQPLALESLDLKRNKLGPDCLDVFVERGQFLPKLSQIHLSSEATGGHEGIRKLRKVFPGIEVITD